MEMAGLTLQAAGFSSHRGRSTATFSLAMLLALFVLGSDLSLVAAGEQQKSARPNIVLIMADDMGYECVEANGGTSYETPRLNEMAAEGLRFTHCFSQPICTPTRVQIMTGIYNQRNYVRFGLLEWNQTTFGNVLQKAGYKTCIAGKWQLEGGLDAPHHFGFDKYALWQLTRRPSRYPSPGLEIMGKEEDFPGKYGPDIASDFICDFIEENKDEPFLVYYPMILPHWPFEPTPDSDEWDPKSKGAGNSQKNPRFFVDMVAYTDKMVGKIVDQVDRLGLSENTIILFTGDNGTATSVVSKMGDREIQGGKGKTTDAGMHVPLIARWPGTMPAGQVCNDLIDFTDVFPTLLELAGAEKPKKIELDGRSFAPQLRGEEGNPRDYIHCWYARNGGPEGVQFTQDKDWKVYANGSVYHVSADPLEKQDLQNSLDSLTQEDRGRLDKLQAALDTYVGTRVLLQTQGQKQNAQKKSNNKNKKQSQNKKTPQ